MPFLIRSYILQKLLENTPLQTKVVAKSRTHRQIWVRDIIPSKHNYHILLLGLFHRTLSRKPSSAEESSLWILLAPYFQRKIVRIAFKAASGRSAGDTGLDEVDIGELGKAITELRNVVGKKRDRVGF